MDGVCGTFTAGMPVMSLLAQEEREPSYCDRILWKSLPSLSANVECRAASAHEAVFTRYHTCTHRMVLAPFTLPVLTVQ